MDRRTPFPRQRRPLHDRAENTEEACPSPLPRPRIGVKIREIPKPSKADILVSNGAYSSTSIRAGVDTVVKSSLVRRRDRAKTEEERSSWHSIPLPEPLPRPAKCLSFLQTSTKNLSPIRSKDEYDEENDEKDTSERSDAETRKTTVEENVNTTGTTERQRRPENDRRRERRFREYAERLRAEVAERDRVIFELRAKIANAASEREKIASQQKKIDEGYKRERSMRRTNEQMRATIAKLRKETLDAKRDADTFRERAEARAKGLVSDFERAQAVAVERAELCEDLKAELDAVKTRVAKRICNGDDSDDALKAKREVRRLRAELSAIADTLEQSRRENAELEEQIRVYESVLKEQERELLMEEKDKEGATRRRQQGAKKKRRASSSSSRTQKGATDVQRARRRRRRS